MTDILKQVDIFGKNFQFTTYKKEKFKTVIGGVMTILCLATLISFGFFFGSDFFFRKGARIQNQVTVPNDYPEPFAMTAKNLPLAWRLEDYYSNTVPFEGRFYPMWKHYEYINNSTGQWLVRSRILPVTKCSDQNIQRPELKKIINMNDFWCLDWTQDNYTFGGYWDGSYTNYFVLKFYFCENFGKFSNTTKCTDLNYVNQQFGGHNLYFQILYPTYNFNPDDQENPLQISYKDYHYAFDPSIQKLDRLFFKSAVLLDDLGWIVKDIKESSLHAGPRMESDFYLFNMAN